MKERNQSNLKSFESWCTSLQRLNGHVDSVHEKKEPFRADFVKVDFQIKKG